MVSSLIAFLRNSVVACSPFASVDAWPASAQATRVLRTSATALARGRIAFHQFFGPALAVQDGGVVTSAKIIADLFQAVRSQQPGQIDRDSPRRNHRLPPRRAFEIGHFQPEMTGRGQRDVAQTDSARLGPLGHQPPQPVGIERARSLGQLQLQDRSAQGRHRHAGTARQRLQNSLGKRQAARQSQTLQDRPAGVRPRQRPAARPNRPTTGFANRPTARWSVAAEPRVVTTTIASLPAKSSSRWSSSCCAEPLPAS